MGTRRKIVFLLAVLTILACLLPALATPAKAQASLSVQILSYDKIGIDSNNPGGTDKQGNPVGPDKSNIQARISNSGDQAATNVVVSFQWTSSNTYVNLSPYETLVISLGNIGPGQQIDVFWLVEIARTKSAINTTRGFRIDVTSGQTSATASQTLTVEGLNSQGQDNSIIVNAPTTVYVGDTFVVEAEATITRSPAYISFPLQFDRSLFELYQVRLDYYVNADFSGNVSLTEYDIYYSVPGGSIPYHGVRAYFTLRAVRAGTGRFASLQIDVNRNQTAFDYNSTIWQYSMQVISLNPSLTISKSDSPDPAAPGSNISYTITYGNTGYGNATNVVITDSIWSEPLKLDTMG